LLQIQADAAGLPLAVARSDATVLGAAMLAGVGAGVFADPAEAAQRLEPARVVTPARSSAERAAQRERWRRFVLASAQL
ncbi:MAG TPA: hypothetical protein VNZ05_00460, partial [Solirubrobacteraceae bacterium]|nr:hypothetical protein [Solirubrobacteraceae bacterium]